MQRVYPESDTTKVVMILIPSKVLESIWPRRFFRQILRTFNRHLERFQTLVLSKHWRSQAIQLPPFRQLMEVTFHMHAWVLLDCEISTSQRILGMKNVWNRYRCLMQTYSRRTAKNYLGRPIGVSVSYPARELADLHMKSIRQ